MHSLRVLTFLHSFEPGGVERVALRLVRQWRQLGVDAPLFVGRCDGALRSELAEDLCHEVPSPRRWAAPFETLWMISTLPGAIRASDPDVLFCAGNTYTIVIIAMKLLLGRRCPPVVAKVSNELWRPGHGWAMSLMYRGWAWLQAQFIDAWVVMHPSMSNELSALGGDHPVSIIPDPALTERQVEILQAWKPRSNTSEGRRFVALGRLVPQKNYQMLLRAFAAGASPGDTLTIYGDGVSRPSLEQLAKQLDLGSRLRLVGHVADSASCLPGEDVFLMTSHFEGIPAALIEAMTCGMPIVATDCGTGVRSLAADYAGAKLVAPSDIEAFAEAIAAREVGVQSKFDFDASPYTIEAGATSYLAAFKRVRRSISSAIPSSYDVAVADVSADGPPAGNGAARPDQTRFL